MEFKLYKIPYYNNHCLPIRKQAVIIIPKITNSETKFLFNFLFVLERQSILLHISQ